MIEQKQNTVETRSGQLLLVERYNRETITPPALGCLARAYATDFWAGAWKELLLDSSGRQYGTFDETGAIYADTAAILAKNGIDAADPTWPRSAWQQAGDGQLRGMDDQPLSQFWSLEKAQEELALFLKAPEQGGFGGEIMMIQDDKGDIVGFTAYAVADPEQGPSLTQQRFPYASLIEDGQEVRETLADLLSRRYPGQRLGIFLDFAISENYRGEGLGSTLFDMRMDRLIDMGADVVVGRTIKTSPAQYNGNYLNRGMEEIAFDPANTDKAIFAVEKERIIPRARRR